MTGCVVEQVVVLVIGLGFGYFLGFVRGRDVEILKSSRAGELAMRAVAEAEAHSDRADELDKCLSDVASILECEPNHVAVLAELTQLVNRDAS